MSVRRELRAFGIPKCKNVGKKGGLPPLLTEGRTDFPKKGDDLEINFDNSSYALFPIGIALRLASAYPKAWCKGGNHFGNYAFEYWYQTVKAINAQQPIPNDCMRWIKKRERYIARHRGDFRLAGVIAMIKWGGFLDAEGHGAEDGSSLGYMVDVIESYGS